jgi:hypothetical protein
MALLVYLDAGGDASRPALSACGWIAHEDQWQAFTIAWENTLKEAGVSELHMRHFAHSRGEFESWKGDENRRAMFLATLATIVKKHTIRHVAVTLHTSVYHALNREATVQERIGSPYVLTMLSAIVLGQIWRDRNMPLEPMQFYVEHGEVDQGVLFKVLRRLEFPHPVRSSPKKFREQDGTIRFVLPFQAADLLAYEYYKGIATMRERGVNEIKGRRSLRALLPIGDDDYSRIIDVHALGVMCKRFGVRRRAKRVE